MGKTTEYLGLYEAADNDFYNVEKDQNENFTILDNKAKEVDEALLSAKGYTDGLAGNVVDSFPLSNATEGKVYREPQNKKYYICTKNYSGSQISLPNSNFENISVNTLLNNGEVSSKLTVKYGAWSNSDKNFSVVKFDVPFKNECLGVTCVDATNRNDTVKPIGIVRGETSKEGFTATFEGYVYTFTYIAFGY